MKRNKKIKRDIVIIILSIVVGLVLLKTGFIEHLLFKSQEMEYLGIFIAGLLFTSAFTTVPAAIALGQLSLVVGLPELVLIGGFGALCGDFIIFKFFKKDISEDFDYLLKLKKNKQWQRLLKAKIFRFFLILTGGLIIISPLPDELGLALMGMSKTNTRSFVLISFACNSVGVLLIALVARAIV